MVISCDRFTGPLQGSSITNLRGRQKIVSILDKFEKGEIGAKDINLKFIELTKGYHKVKLPIKIELYTYPDLKFEFSIIHDDLAAVSGPVIIEFEYKKSSGEYALSVKAQKIDYTGTTYDVTAQFID